jgi:hypothetical protein
MDVYRLIYCSKNALKSSGEALGADLKLILRSAIRNNRSLNITGGLVFSRDHFVQVLEGAQLAVARTFSRIVADLRHTEIMLIEAKPVAEPSFAAWSMGYAGNAALFDELSHNATIGGVLDPARINADDLVASVHALVHSEMHMISTRPPAKTSTLV